MYAIVFLASRITSSAPSNTSYHVDIAVTKVSSEHSYYRLYLLFDRAHNTYRVVLYSRVRRTRACGRDSCVIVAVEQCNVCHEGNHLFFDPFDPFNEHDIVALTTVGRVTDVIARRPRVVVGRPMIGTKVGTPRKRFRARKY